MLGQRPATKEKTMKEITKKDGTPFGNKGSLAMVLKDKGLTDTHEIVAKGAGFVGQFNANGTPKVDAVISEVDKAAALKTKPEVKLIKVRVFRSNVDPDNRDTPISVTLNTLNRKRIFWPGEEVELEKGHLNILKDSVEEVNILIPPESGIYASRDPIAVAKNFYPNMQARVNPTDNTITMTSRIPNYIIEYVE